MICRAGILNNTIKLGKNERMQAQDNNYSNHKFNKKKSLSFYFMDSSDIFIMDSDALRDLVSFVQFKKRKKHPCRRATFLVMRFEVVLIIYPM